MSETVAQMVSGTGSRRWLKWLLVASLALNLLILGALGTAAWRFRHAPPVPGPNAINAHLLGFIWTLPSERRQAIWSATRGEREAMRPFRLDVRTVRLEARAAMTAMPFDLGRFSEAQRRVLDAENKARVAAHTLFVAVAAGMTPEERAAFATWQPPAGSGGGRGRGWWKRREPAAGPANTSGDTTLPK